MKEQYYKRRAQISTKYTTSPVQNYSQQVLQETEEPGVRRLCTGTES
jgi:hypothetical protein